MPEGGISKHVDCQRFKCSDLKAALNAVVLKLVTMNKSIMTAFQTNIAQLIVR